MPRMTFANCVTGIGSLPHSDAEEAVAFVAKYCPEVPFWPQLPQRSDREYMLLQTLSPMLDLLHQLSPAQINVLPGRESELLWHLRTGQAEFDATSASGYFAFERACHDGLFSGAQWLKGQITGPLTLASCIYVNDGHRWQPLIAIPLLMDALTAYVGRLAAWQAERLARFGRPVMVFVDEPMLAASVRNPAWLAYLPRVLADIRHSGALAGIHCCAAGAASAVFTAAPDIISFDAHSELERYLRAPEMPAFLAHGGTAALGLVPTSFDLDTFSPEAALAHCISQVLDHGIAADRLLRQSLITATCGLGLLSPDAARASFVRAQRMGQLLQNQEATVRKRVPG